MGLLHLVKLKFRHPVPHAPGKKLDHIFQYMCENHAMDNANNVCSGGNNPTCMPSDPQVSFVLLLPPPPPPTHPKKKKKSITICMIACLDYANNVCSGGNFIRQIQVMMQHQLHQYGYLLKFQQIGCGKFLLQWML